jgi:hypothetical protein
MTKITRVPKASVAYLLTLFDAAFVHGAYTVLLGRAADPTGFAHYLAKVRAGIAREDIIAGIATSQEGQSKRLSVEGLSELTQGTHTRTRRFLRKTLSGPGAVLAQQMRAIENRLATAASNTDARFEKLEAKFQRVEASRVSEHRAQVGDSSGVGSPKVAGDDYVTTIDQRVGAHARLEQNIFDRLKSKIHH